MTAEKKYKQWLKPEERKQYEGNADFIKRYPADDCEELCQEQVILERLAECRRLMTEHPPDVITIEEYGKWQQAIDVEVQDAKA